VFVRMGKKCTPASGSSTLPRRTRPKGSKRVSVTPPPTSPEGGKRSSFRNTVFSSFQNTGRWTKSENPVILSVVRTQLPGLFRIYLNH
jgi:hypothetical protein